MGENVLPELVRFVRNGVFIGVALFGFFAVGLWCVLLLSFVGITTWPAKPSLSTLFASFAMALSILLALLWVSAAVGVVKLSAHAQDTIRKYLVVSVLGAVGSAIGSALSGA